MNTNRLSTCNVMVLWRLPLNENESSQDFEVGKVYNFTTIGNASLPLDIPIDFVNQDNEVLGQARILEYFTNLEKTEGKFEVISLKDVSNK